MNNETYDQLLRDFVTESNRIEGIIRAPLPIEINATRSFMNLEKVEVHHLESLANVYSPGAQLRRRPGMDVRVGGYTPPFGGPRIEQRLHDLLLDTVHLSAFEAHCRYESLHPFTDGNGRTGRALWARMSSAWDVKRGFLHSFYYQALSAREDRV